MKGDFFVMKSMCIKSNNKYIIDYLLNDFSNIDLDYVYLSSNSFKIYDNVIVHYFGENIDDFYEVLCDTLTRCILFFYEKKITKNIIDYNYFYFNDAETKQILDSCIDLFNFDEKIYEEKYLAIYNSVHTYVLEHHSIVLSGFVTFRLKDYRDILDCNIDLCVNNFLIEREYYEFINILHLYVNSKESIIDVVHLVYANNESILLDNNKNIISTREYLFDAKYLSDISFSSNDYCLNTLLNLLPKQLNIHLINNVEDEFITTLKLIFENRVSVCSDCDICRVYRLTNNVTAKHNKLL